MEALEGDGVDPALQRRLPRPAAAAGQLARRSALIVALRALREAATTPCAPIVDRALAKLESAAGDGAALAAQVEVRLPQQAGRIAAPARPAVAGALDERRQVRLDYHVPSRDESTERVVDPLRLVTADGTHLPRGLVPPRRRPAAVPARPDLAAPRCSTRRSSRPPTRARVTWPPGSSSRLDRRPAGHAAARARRPLGGRVLPGGEQRARRADGGLRCAAGRRPGLAARGCCCGSGRRPSWSTRPSWRPASARWPPQALLNYA